MVSPTVLIDHCLVAVIFAVDRDRLCLYLHFLLDHFITLSLTHLQRPPVIACFAQYLIHGKLKFTNQKRKWWNVICRILLTVPIVYMLLNTPFYLLRITDTIALYVFQSKAFSIIGGLHDTVIIFLYNTAHYLYYISFACDFLVYAFSRLVHCFCNVVQRHTDWYISQFIYFFYQI